MKCHFVYAVPNAGSKISRFQRKVKTLLNRSGVPISTIGNRKNIKTHLWMKKSPYTITKHLYEALSCKMPTYLYHLTERLQIQFDDSDIFIGHPFFPFHKNTVGVTELSLRQRRRPRVSAIITPLHCNLQVKTNHLNKDYLEAVNTIIPYVDVVFAIMGEYWWKQWDWSPYAHWKSKMVRLDMAINTDDYPRVKKSFNPPGKRGYLYIGKNDPVKGIDFLCELFKKYNKYPVGWIGSGKDIPGIQRVSVNRPLTPDFMTHIARQYDFFITTSLSDANPTTILESMSWGFPVMCTPQSGYFESNYIKNVFSDNLEKSIQLLDQLQFAPEADLIQIADQANAVVKKDYTWDIFLCRIMNTLNNLCIKKGMYFVQSN